MDRRSWIYFYSFFRKVLIGVKLIQSKSIFLVLLSIAFLSMQWSYVHVHLSEHHNHDGSHHQHNVELHSHHAGAIDHSHSMDDRQGVKIEQECSHSNGSKLAKFSPTALPVSYLQPHSSQHISIALPIISNTKISHLYQSPAQSRAPPLYRV